MPKTDTPPGKKLPKNFPAAAYSIWLAGLGALAAAKDEKGGHKLFSRLIERGRDVEALGAGEVHEADEVRFELGDGMIWLGLPRQKRVENLIARLGSETTEIEEIREQLRFHEAYGWHDTAGADVASPPARSAAEVANLRRNAQARRAFLAEFGTLTSREVAENAGSRATNQAALANRWKAEGRIFTIETGGQTLFPAFQFSDDDGQPRPVIAEILAVLQPKLTGWQTALWFSGRNGWLGAKRPVDILSSNPSAAAEAAHQEAEAFD